MVATGGQAVTTGPDGRFEFPALSVGEHLIHVAIDDALAPNQILTPAAPHLVNIAEARSTRVDFEIITGASVTGVLRVQSPEDAVETVDDIATGDELASGVRIELSNGTTTVHAVTDAKGTFRINRVAAGDWTIRVADRDLPENYLIEPNERSLTLQPGDIERVEFQLIPVVRRIRFEEGGTLTPPSLP
ncbi:MAG: hypothetical protein WD314_10450 [Trueperaceae bacterium]